MSVTKGSCVREAYDEDVVGVVRRIVDRNTAVFEALAPHDTHDPARTGRMVCGCCRCVLADECRCCDVGDGQ